MFFKGAADFWIFMIIFAWTGLLGLLQYSYPTSDYSLKCNLITSFITLFSKQSITNDLSLKTNDTVTTA